MNLNDIFDIVLKDMDLYGLEKNADHKTAKPVAKLSVPGIRHISYCDEPGKEKVIVIFEDNTKVIKTMVPSDKFDLNVGVALCIAERMFETKTKFHKMVQKKLKK